MNVGARVRFLCNVLFVLLFAASVTAAPLVVANYFIMYQSDSAQSGAPAQFTPTQLQHNVGRANGNVWTATSGPSGLLSSGPSQNLNSLIASVGQANGGTFPSNRFTLRIVWELMAEDVAFSQTPVGTISIYGTSAAGARTIYARAIYPQDFKQPFSFQNFSLTVADYVPGPDEQLDFRVYWNGGQRVSIKNIYIVPLAFSPTWQGWHNVPWNGGTTPTAGYRIFNPETILTSNLQPNMPLYPTATVIGARGSIDWWRRDLQLGMTGEYPYIGPYDQSDDALLRYDIRLAKSAGINAFKVYMYYPNNPKAFVNGQCRSDWQTVWSWDWRLSAFDRMLDIAAQENFSLFIDDSQLSEVSERSTSSYTYEDALCNANFVKQKGYFIHPGYLRINGKPAYGLPVIYQTNAANVSAFIANLNSVVGQQLYTFVTATTAYGVQSPDVNLYGPYDMQALYLDFNNRDDLGYVDAAETSTSYRNQLRNWSMYAVCSVDPLRWDDVLDGGKCQCKYDTARPVDQYCVFLSTLLARPYLSSFRNLPGVSSLFDWTAVGAVAAPRYLYLNIDAGNASNTQYVWRTAADMSISKRMFRAYVDDAHAYGYSATITVSPGHDKSGWQGGPRISRVDDVGTGLRFQRLLMQAFEEAPDVIMIENWNGWGEGVQIQPSTGYSDPYVYLRAVASATAKSFTPPCIPREIVDPIRLPYIGTGELCPLPTMEGDVNGDRIVDVLDMQAVIKDIGRTAYDPRVDLTAPFGTINLFDLMAVVRNLGRSA